MNYGGENRCSCMWTKGGVFPDVEFTGLSAPYEAPENPEIHIDGAKSSIEDSVKTIMDYLLSKRYI